MALSQDQTNRIEEIVKGILSRRIENFPEDSSSIRNAPFHEIILKAFEDRIGVLNIKIPYLIALSSWLHGLNTSLGTGFEQLAHVISGGYKRKFTGAFTLKVKKSQASSVENIIRELKAGPKVRVPNLKKENKLIFGIEPSEQEVDALGFTVDNYVETNTDIEAIELKSVRPNAGEGRGEKQKILYAKAALKLKNSNKDIKYYIGFPFDPTADKATSYNKQRFFDYLVEFKKFFASEEVLIGAELWDHLSGSKNTMEEILDIIATVVDKIK